jgi:hypothetical protein
MKPATKRVFTLLAVPVLASALAGCGGVAVSGPGYTSVYDDYGYVGPWDGGRVEVAGGYFVEPPRGRPDQDRHNEDRGRPGAAAPERNRPPEHQAPPQHAAPVQRAAPRAIPSIPSNPRPAPQRAGNDKNKH